jgi:hypothetical protein
MSTYSATRITLRVTLSTLCIHLSGGTLIQWFADFFPKPPFITGFLYLSLIWENRGFGDDNVYNDLAGVLSGGIQKEIQDMMTMRTEGN